MSVFPYVITCHEYIYAVFATGVCDLQGICNNNLANFKKKTLDVFTNDLNILSEFSGSGSAFKSNIKLSAVCRNKWLRLRLIKDSD